MLSPCIYALHIQDIYALHIQDNWLRMTCTTCSNSKVQQSTLNCVLCSYNSMQMKAVAVARLLWIDVDAVCLSRLRQGTLDGCKHHS